MVEDKAQSAKPVTKENATSVVNAKDVSVANATNVKSVTNIESVKDVNIAVSPELAKLRKELESPMEKPIREAKLKEFKALGGKLDSVKGKNPTRVTRHGFHPSNQV